MFIKRSYTLMRVERGEKMKHLTLREHLSQFEHLQTSGLAYELIREVVLPDLLGKEMSSILYWSGKNIARKYPLISEDEIIQFFKDVGWGELQIKERKSNVIEFQLSSDFITARNQSRKDSSYHLEAGFLAQQFEHIHEVVTEAYVDNQKRLNIVHITVKSDQKDPI
jgi:predicted hydrocarbon binding protein